MESNRYILHILYDQMGRFDHEAYSVKIESINQDDLLASLIDPVHPKFIRFKDSEGDWHIYPTDSIVSMHGHVLDPKRDMDIEDGDEWKHGGNT